MADLDPADVVASFDSASVLHAAVAAALHGSSFPHLGSGRWYAGAVRLGGTLPWGLLRRLYTRIGASEGLPPERLKDVDLTAVAAHLADAYPARRYPVVMIGSSNGALAHLAAALQAPWLPHTLLVPVRRAGDPDRLDETLAFGAGAAAPLLARNRDVVLHHMADPTQDALMSAEMTYFRTKWSTLPDPYADFLIRRLAPGGTVVLVNDTSDWPVTRIGGRHVFQSGGRGGIGPDDYLARPHTPPADDRAAEAEWGLEPSFAAAVRCWCAGQGVELIELTYDGPQAPAAGVAEAFRAWCRRRGEPADRLAVPSFVLGDPWQTLLSASVPFWTFFPVQPALQALDDYLQTAEPYADVHLFAFEHGADSPGIATPDEFAATVRRHGARPHIEALHRGKFPHDIGSLARYGPAYQALPRAQHPFSALSLDDALPHLAQHGISAHTT